MVRALNISAYENPPWNSKYFVFGRSCGGCVQIRKMAFENKRTTIKSFETCCATSYYSRTLILLGRKKYSNFTLVGGRGRRVSFGNANTCLSHVKYFWKFHCEGGLVSRTYCWNRYENPGKFENKQSIALFMRLCVIAVSVKEEFSIFHIPPSWSAHYTTSP